MPTTKPRARDLGLPLPGTPGPCNAITDVAGVEVGFTTLTEFARKPGDTQICTGVTAILPRGHNPRPLPVWAGQFDVNGNGEMTGTHWIRDAGGGTGMSTYEFKGGIGTSSRRSTRNVCLACCATTGVCRRAR
jgi:L-aminopeptidase/D-esterase-like protein